MSDISLQQLLEAGCHFGHKSERWHPKAGDYIYTKKDGIHIIDLVKTKEGLERAAAFVCDLAAAGSKILFVATKRQAKEIVKTEAIRIAAPYVTERWIGGFLTNWEGIQNTIKKINRLTDEEKTDAWKKFPKHERVKLGRYLKRLNFFYSGVVSLTEKPAALFLIDLKKESVALREAVRTDIPVVAIVDTNVDPVDVTYPIPANDDAVGSITIITKTIADAYEVGKKMGEKGAEVAPVGKPIEKTEEHEEGKTKETKEAVKKSRGRPASTRADASSTRGGPKKDTK
jgi:small subunit ribosomal protein S2